MKHITSQAIQSDLLLLDVRSPAEFEQGHIPGARSLPLFTDDQRAEIGTLYKQVGPSTALKKGLELVGPRLVPLLEQVEEWAHRGSAIQLHCWRGGMRSNAVAQLLQFAGYEPLVIQGGYKAWRQAGQETLQLNWQFKVLTGYTGSGKTEVLQQLHSLGEQVIDLENLANHRGSSFGSLGKGQQPTSEQFHNSIWYQLMKMSTDRPVWIEDESYRIGNCHLPDTLFEKMKNADWVRMEIPKAHRLEHSIALYGKATKDQLEAAIRRLEKRLGGLRMQQCLEALEQNDAIRCTNYLLDYYDKSYNKSLAARDAAKGRTLTFDHANHLQIAKTLQKLHDE